MGTRDLSPISATKKIYRGHLFEEEETIQRINIFRLTP